MNSEIPRVTIVGAITPSAESMRAEQLEYPNLERVVDKHVSFENARINKFWKAEAGSLEEAQGARQLASQYMLMSSLALTRSLDPSLWSKRYTEATTELFGTPDTEVAQKLWSQQESGRAYEIDSSCKEAAEKVGDFMKEYYAPVFEALDMYPEGEPISPEGIATALESAMAELVNYDTEWANWGANRNPKIDLLRIDVDEKFIDVGMRRAAIGRQQLKGLFSHEVLVHALRSINGAKISDELARGLPDFQDAEEGLGVFVGYAVSGELSERVVDRYVDIAYALGQIDGETHTRKELIEHAIKRAKNRNVDGSKSIELIEKEVYSHVNRIFRGSLGADDVGVMTKDISYYKGFMNISAFINSRIDDGESIEEIVTFLMKGKFDPLNQQHIDYINRA